MKVQPRIFVFAVIGTLLSGCGHNLKLYEPPNLAANMEEAGSVHLAVLSVGKWDDYRQALMPNFGLKCDDAKSAAVQASREQADAELDATRLALGVAVDASSKPTSAAPPTDNPQPSDLRAQTAEPKAFAIDPMTSYVAGAALCQEVQLLNRYLGDLVAEDGFFPYVVRLQLSVMPNGRRRAYDTYANLSFFGHFESSLLSEVSTPEIAGRTPGTPYILQTTRSAAFNDYSAAVQESIQSIKDPAEAANVQQRLEEAQKKHREPPRNPIIIPALVTDELETASHTRSVDQIRQLALALSYVRGVVGAGLGFESTAEQLGKALGHDTNSLFTIARLSPNTLRVRFGAEQEIATEYAMVPQTHNVTLIVLAPHEVVEQERLFQRRIDVLMRTELRSTDSGQELPPRDPAGRSERLAKISQLYQPYFGCALSTESLENLSVLVQSNLQEQSFYSSLAAVLKSSCPGSVQKADAARYAEALWSDLTALVVGGRQSVETFRLPSGPDWGELSFSPLIDDGETLKFSVWSTAALPTRNVAFSLRIGKSPGPAKPTKCSAADFYELPVSEIETSADGRQIDLTYPSPALATPLGSDAAKLGRLQYSVRLACPESRLLDDACNVPKFDCTCTDGHCEQRQHSLDSKNKTSLHTLAYAHPAKPKKSGADDKTASLDFSFNTDTDTVWLDTSGKGSLMANIKLPAKSPAKKVTISSDKASITAVAGAPDKCVSGAAPWTVTADCSLTISLANASDSFVVTAKSGKGQKPLTLKAHVPK